LLLALAACALVTTVASSPTRGDTTIEPGIDRPGKDLKPGFGVGNVEECRDECDKDAKCKGYTFVISTRLCFLKSSVPRSRANSCCTSGVKDGWRSGPFSVRQEAEGNRKMLLEPDSTDVCVLTRVSGKFMGGGETVRVVVVNGRWVLEVASHQQEGVTGTAFCFKKNSFKANGPARLTSPPFEATDLFSPTNTFNGDAATFISGVNGHLRGGGEHARIVQSSEGSTPSELRVGSAAGDLKAFAHSFFAGTVGIGTPAKFFQGEFTMNHVVSRRSVVMANTEFAMCYLTLVKGKFDNVDDFVEIVPQTVGRVKRWVLRAQRAKEEPFLGLGAAPYATGEVFVAARCYRRDQRL
jgi:hypothetical protein